VHIPPLGVREVEKNAGDAEGEQVEPEHQEQGVYSSQSEGGTGDRCGCHRHDSEPLKAKGLDPTNRSSECTREGTNPVFADIVGYEHPRLSWPFSELIRPL